MENIKDGHYDYIMEMFESYFHYLKITDKTTKEDIHYAINGALSSLDVEFQKESLLSRMIDDCKLLKQVAEFELEVSNRLKGELSNANEQLSEKKSKGWLSKEEVTCIYGISDAKLKDAKWRDKNKFPCHQEIKGGKMIFYPEEVENWLNNNKK